MHKDERLTEIPAVVIKEVSEPPEEAMGKLEDNKDEEAYQDFVTTFLDKLCENCKKMREQIIIKAKCAGVLPDENVEVENFVPESLVALIPEAQRKVIDNIRRRTVSNRVCCCGLLFSFPSLTTKTMAMHTSVAE